MEHLQAYIALALNDKRKLAFIILLLAPIGFAAQALFLYLSFSRVEVVTGDEELQEWVSSVINADSDTVTFDNSCVMEVHDGAATIQAPCEAVNTSPAVAVAYELNGRAIGPINTSMPEKPNVGWLTRDMNEVEMRWMLLNKGFRHLSGMNEAKLRQLLVAYEYEPFLWRVHERTGLPVSVIFAYFIVEATRQGVESELLRGHYNPGGVKYRGIGDVAYYYDDCRDAYGRRIKCRFESLSGYDQMEEVWAGVFNNTRYMRCREYSTVDDICHCLYRAGYHTGNNWRLRAKVAKRYWVYRSKFPRPELMAAKNN